MQTKEAIDLIISIDNLDLKDIATKHSVDAMQLYEALTLSKPLRTFLGISADKATKLNNAIVPGKNPKHKASTALFHKHSLKECPLCNEVLFTEEYWLGATYCIDCSKDINDFWHENNPNKRAVYSKTYIANNRAAINAAAAKKRADKVLATPKWADLLAIKEIYKTCPEGYHVDHIVPLNGANVCGLHVEYNLQHLPARDNIRKGNSFNTTT